MQTQSVPGVTREEKAQIQFRSKFVEKLHCYFIWQIFCDWKSFVPKCFQQIFGELF